MPRPSCLTPGKRPGTHYTEGWVGTVASLDGCGKSHLHQHSMLACPTPSKSLYQLLGTEGKVLLCICSKHVQLCCDMTQNNTSKAIPLQAWAGHQGCGRQASRISRQMHMNMVTSALRTSLCGPQEISLTESTQRLCSKIPLPTVPQRTPVR